MFEIDQLPYQELAVLGLSKESILQLPEKEQQALLLGQRSSLTRFTNVQLKDALIEALDAKISFKIEESGLPSLVIHPIQKEALNIYQLSDREVKDLISGKESFIDKTVDSKKSIIMYDKDLNDFFVSRQQLEIKQEIIPVKERKKQEELTSIVNEPRTKSNYEVIKGLVGNVFLFALDGGLSIAVKALIRSQQNIQDPLINKDLSKKKVADAISPLGTVSNASAGIPAIKDLTRTESDKSSLSNTKEPVLTKQGSMSTLIDYGPAPYQFNENNKPSYFVTIQTGIGERTVWGIDLKRAIEESQVIIGDKISLNNLGQQPVKISQEKKNEQGEIVGVEVIETKRNEWSIELIEKAPLQSEQLKDSNRISGIDAEASAYAKTNNMDHNGMDSIESAVRSSGRTF